MTIYEGQLSGQGKNFAVVAARFNELITSKLVDGAMDCLKRHQTSKEDIDLAWVPGAYEIPLLAKKMAETNRYDALICLGAVIRGATPHFEYVSSEVSKGISMVSFETSVPVIYGILTTDTIEQAVERAGTKSGNKGWEAGLNALEMSNLMEQIKE